MVPPISKLKLFRATQVVDYSYQISIGPTVYLFPRKKRKHIHCVHVCIVNTIVTKTLPAVAEAIVVLDDTECKARRICPGHHAWGLLEMGLSFERVIENMLDGKTILSIQNLKEHRKTFPTLKSRICVCLRKRDPANRLRPDLLLYFLVLWQPWRERRSRVSFNGTPRSSTEIVHALLHAMCLFGVNPPYFPIHQAASYTCTECD